MTPRPDPLADPGIRATGLDVEILIVGAGISGIGAGIELVRRGIRSFVLLEASEELGGTWRDNTYPGIAVDITSSSYCFSFETDYPWSRAFATGREILNYVQHCARKYGIYRHIRYNSTVRCARFGADVDRWSTHLIEGQVVTSRYLISATGLFGQPRLPEIPGLDTFAGIAMHSARWDHAHELSGERVAIIGTGASAVQIVPEIAPQVAHLSVFQRTAIWISPRFDYALRPGSALAPRRLAGVRALRRFVSELRLEALTFSIVNFRRLPLIVRTVQACLRFFMCRQIHDPDLAARLIPDYELGCKRPASSNTYLTTFNLPHVALVTDSIERICPEGLVTKDSQLHEVDTIILATGFLTTEQGNAPSFEVVGPDGIELGQFWEDHRRQAYAGVAVQGYPNFFLTAGPYSGGFNWFTMLQAQLDHIMQCIEGARALGATLVEVQREAHERYMSHMWRRAEGTVFKDASCQSARSYYIDRHGDASLPFPHTPWWRVLHGYRTKTRDYRFGRGRQK